MIYPPTLVLAWLELTAFYTISGLRYTVEKNLVFNIISKRDIDMNLSLHVVHMSEKLGQFAVGQCIYFMIRIG